ncbi:hypothetical protein GCM10015535_17020 [Streptomyces gelaticus]|uniref:DUF3631 domain-containing protein n=1 Tax=Streptomyces gelaticus TaxID=285446 RepID=A0ABQ2VUF2_9ACTN|nr:hypothetical protein GCM10015535_17020 [Streptomyces gelaticus]
MEDPTSTAAPNASEVVWPTPAVPGQGIPWRNGDRTESRSPASMGVPVGDRNSANAAPVQVSALGTGPADPDTGDRTVTSGPPVPEPGPRIPGEHGAFRADGESHGPHTSAGTVVPDGGSGTGDRAGTGGETADEGAALLDDLRAAIGRYVVLPSEEALTAVTLWVTASHTQPALQHAPRLAVVGPTKGCGKSRVLDVLHETVYQPMMTVNTSPAVVFRVIGKNPPTLLVDEADTIFGPKAGDKEDLRGLLNAGHQRNRPAWRISGPEHKPTAFPTFAMAALAGIGDLPDTIMDRAIVLRMQKRKPGEKIAAFRSRYSVPELNALRDRLTAWLTPLRGAAERLVPPMPVEDRAADTWEPLVIVADLAGGHWPSRARAACLTMTRNEVVQDEQTTLKTRLLRDLRRVFEQQGDMEALRSHDLLAALAQDAEAPWAEYGTKGLNAYHLANLLRDFGISPANHRFENGRQAKAYARNQFLDAWARYCPDPAQPAPAAAEAVLAHRAQGKPPAPLSGTLPICPPGGPAGPRPTR